MRIKKTAILFAPFLVILFNLLLHFHLASSTRFISDDFCSAAMAKRLGVFRAAWYWYLNWSGRYSASVLDALFGLLGPWATAIAIPLFVLFWLSVLSVTIWLYLSYSRREFLKALLLGASILFLSFLLSPNIRQSIYWGQGMRSVLPPMILITLYIGIFKWFQSPARTNVNLYLSMLVTFLLVLGMGGFSETFVVLQIALFSIALLCEVLEQNKSARNFHNSYLLASALAGSLLALLIILNAPGNTYRQAQLPSTPGFIGILSISIESFVDFLRNLFDLPERILGVLGCVGIALYVGYQNEARHFSNQNWLLFPVLTLGFMYVCFPPAAYGLSDAPPDRTLIIPVHIFSIAVVMFGYFAGNQLQRYPLGLTVIRGLSIAALVMFAVSNYLTDVKLINSKGVFVEFAEKWDARHFQILADKDANKEQAIVSTMDDVNWAGATTIHSRPKFWLNQCVSLYYGIETIAVDSPDQFQNEAQ